MNNMKRNACQKCAFAVYDDNPHCGLRGFRTSFNVERCSAENDTAPNGYELQEDGYFSWVEKKKEYPETYEECIGKLPINWDGKVEGYKSELLNNFQKLLICRDTYWKIYGEEMGLGKPWKPDWSTFQRPFKDGDILAYNNTLSKLWNMAIYGRLGMHVRNYMRSEHPEIDQDFINYGDFEDYSWMLINLLIEKWSIVNNLN